MNNVLTAHHEISVQNPKSNLYAPSATEHRRATISTPGRRWHQGANHQHLPGSYKALAIPDSQNTHTHGSRLLKRHTTGRGINPGERGKDSPGLGRLEIVLAIFTPLPPSSFRGNQLQQFRLAPQAPRGLPPYPLVASDAPPGVVIYFRQIHRWGIFSTHQGCLNLFHLTGG